MTTLVVQCTLPCVTTLLERLEKIIERGPLNASDLSLAAGLKRTHISTAIGRLRAKPGKADIERATLAKIAKAAGVSVDWLATGDGEMTPGGADAPARRIDPDPRYPNLAIAVGNLRGVVDAEVLDTAWETRLSSHDDIAVERWEDVLIAAQKRRNRAKAAIAAGGEAPFRGSDDDVRAEVARVLAAPPAAPTSRSAGVPLLPAGGKGKRGRA